VINLLRSMFHRAEKIPLDKLQLDAAQDRLRERSETLNVQVDEFTKMMRRIKRTQRRGKQK
jgi:uncharacterized membrane protein